MDRNAANSYIYARACGKLAKSFTGEKVNSLFDAKTLSELWTLLFSSQPPVMPEVLLAQEIEKQAFANLIKTYSTFISCYDNPPEFLKSPLVSYDAENLKEIGAALTNNESECPSLIDVGEFSSLDVKAWPDIAAITKKSLFSWYNKVPEIHSQQNEELRIDMQVVKILFDSLNCAKGDGSDALRDLYTEEYILKNIVWALRLKINYQMKNEEILDRLINICEQKNKRSNLKYDIIAKPAVQILDWQTDVYEDWAEWKYASLLNPHENGSVWYVEPSFIETKAKQMIHKKAVRLFHQYPATEAAIAAWFEIKDFELGCIRAAVERIRLNVSKEDALKSIGF